MRNFKLLFTCVFLCGSLAVAKAGGAQKKRMVASASNKEQSCAKQARRALLQNSQQMPENSDTDASFEFFNGAMVGDAGMAVEIDVYKNKNSGSFYKVELNGEMCTLRSIEFLM